MESPNVDLLNRWRSGEFVWLWSRDTPAEYARKLIELGIPPATVQSFLARLIVAGEVVTIAVFHERPYPQDPDDIAFVLCAINGRASHLVTHDRRLTVLDGEYEFRICGTSDFLSDLSSR